jgi:hypothetical protein
MLFGEIIAHHADQIDGGKEARAEGGVARRPAEQVGMLRHGGFDSIERDGTNNEDGHG